jgi:hypothetical protein
MEAKDGKRWLLKGEVRTVVVQICDLLSGDAVCPACGRADVHSKRTSYERGNAEFGQSLQLENLGMMRGYLHRHNHAIQPAASQEVDNSYQ